MYGGVSTDYLDENSIFDPKSPYAAGKVFAHHMTKIYRESYNLFCVNGILFNHESPERGETFVTRKITRGIGRIVHGIQNNISLGNLDAVRDWGFAGDYVEAMWLMMQYKEADDWVIATGEAHSVKEFLDISFNHVGLKWEDYVKIDEKYIRPNEVNHLLGNPNKAKNLLNWKPKVSFEDLAVMMVESDLKLAEQEKVLLEKNLISKTWED